MSMPWKRMALVRVPAQPAGLWELAAEYVNGSRLLRMQVVGQDDKGNTVATTWRPDKKSKAEATADGLAVDPEAAQKPDKNAANLLTKGARRGALIAKIGGSTADVPDTASALGPYGTKKVFCVGSQCIIALAATEGGPLFLTMNDWPECFGDHDGALHVLIEEYPT